MVTAKTENYRAKWDSIHQAVAEEEVEQEALAGECKELEKKKGGSESGGRFPGLGDPMFKGSIEEVSKVSWEEGPLVG